jgi:single-stranded DNA-binding protein
MAYSNVTFGLVGFIGSDPKEIEILSDTNRKYAEFNLATNVKNNNKTETTIWWNCSIFDEKVADFALKYLKKGRQVLVNGELRGVATYLDKKDNTPKLNMRVKVYNVTALDNNNRNAIESKVVDDPNKPDYVNKFGSKVVE